MNEFLTIAQLGVSVVCILGLLVGLGRKDQQLIYLSRAVDELKGISTDLVKSQVSTSRDLAHHKELLDDLMRRVRSLERPPVLEDDN